MTLDQSPPHRSVDQLPEPPHWDEPPEPEPHYPTPTERPAAVPVPHDSGAEQYVLGAALLDPQQITNCSPLLTASDFWNPFHEQIWRTLVQLHAAGDPTAPEAVVPRLLQADPAAFKRYDGGTYIFDLLHRCAIPARADYYARIVEKHARHRAAITAYRQGLQQLERPLDDTQIDQILRDTADRLADTRDALSNLPAPTTWSPVDLTSVMQGDYLDPPPTMLMRSDGVCLLYDGSVHVVAGESESGKTWLTLLAAVQVLERGDRVVFIDFEDRADRVVGRLMGLGATPDQINNQFDYIRPDRPLDDDGRHQLAPAIDGARLVILDGVTEAMTLHGLDLNSNSDSALFQGLLPRWIADHGPAVVMIDHVVKDKEKQGRFALGAQHKLAGIDGVQYLVQVREPFARGRRGIATVDIGKDRPGHVREHAQGKRIAEFTLDSSADGNVLVAHLKAPREHGDPFEPTVYMERVSRFVQANEGSNKKAIELGVNGKANLIRQALELLVARNFIGTKAGPRGSTLHFHQEAYYQPSDDPDDDQNQPPDPWLDAPTSDPTKPDEGDTQ